MKEQAQRSQRQMEEEKRIEQMRVKDQAMKFNYIAEADIPIARGTYAAHAEYVDSAA